MAEYIDREKVREKACRGCTRHIDGVCYTDEPCSHLIATFLNEPAADVAPVVHGTWEERDDGWGGTYYHCSACGEDWCTIEGTPVENGMKYCPHCGAKMDQEG